MNPFDYKDCAQSKEGGSISEASENISESSRCKNVLNDRFTPDEIEAMGWPEDLKRDQLRRNACGDGYRLFYRNADIGIVVFEHTESDGHVTRRGFSGKRMKEDFYYLFQSVEHADSFVHRWTEERRRDAELKAKRKAELAIKMAQPHKLKAGDVLYCSWGWEQTNIDYFEVTALVGRRTVEIRKIAKNSTETLWQQGTCTPKKGHFIGKALRRKVLADGDAVKINSICWASLEVPKTENGIETYPPRYWTAYA